MSEPRDPLPPHLDGVEPRVRTQPVEVPPPARPPRASVWRGIGRVVRGRARELAELALQEWLDRRRSR